MKADYPLCLLNIVVNKYQKRRNYGDEILLFHAVSFELERLSHHTLLLTQ